MQVRRHGGLIFADLRDETGQIQLMVSRGRSMRNFGQSRDSASRLGMPKTIDHRAMCLHIAR